MSDVDGKGTPANGMIRVLAVTSGKGGVGKSNVSINLGLALRARGHRVMLLDADLGLANIDVLLGLRPERNLAHVMDGECELEDILLDAPGGLMVVPAASGIKRMAEMTASENAGLVHAFSELAGLTDVLIIDTAAGISDSAVSFCTAAQEIIVVVCNEPASLTDAYAMIKVLNQDYGQRRFRVLVNMAHAEEETRQLFLRLVDVCRRFLDVSLELSGAIPFDPHVRKAVQRQKPVYLAYPDSPSAQAFKELAGQADNWPVPDGASGGLEFFVERLIGHAPGAGRVSA